jgi:serpin B
MKIQLPKFKFEYKTLLNKVLSDMGLEVAFGGGAEFPLLVEESQNLYISRVIHKTFVDVNEKGTEAAAVTVVEIRETSAIDTPMLFSVDKPFLFVIREKMSNAIVFMGRVGNPEY